MKKDTTEAHCTTDADWEYVEWEDEEWNYPDKGYFEESHLLTTLTMRRNVLPSLWTPLLKKERNTSMIWTHERRCETRGTPWCFTQSWLSLHHLASRARQDVDKERAKVKVRELLEQDAHHKETALPSSPAASASAGSTQQRE